MLGERWAELLRQKSLFPLEAELRPAGGGPARMVFRVVKVRAQKITDNGVFRVPDGFREEKARSF
jgi:hypothetical protein